jgi:hypothetical protein
MSRRGKGDTYKVSSAGFSPAKCSNAVLIPSMPSFPVAIKIIKVLGCVDISAQPYQHTGKLHKRHEIPRQLIKP